MNYWPVLSNWLVTAAAALFHTVECQRFVWQAESLQEELDSLKEKHEELSTSMQLLQTELESGAGGSAQGVSSYQVKQLEQQNEKLKEALVKWV